MEPHLQETQKKRIEKKDTLFLSPLEEVPKVRGKIFYHESSQAHSVLRFTKEILCHYPQLRDKSSSFSYLMVVPRSIEEVKTQLKELKKNPKRIPIILFLEREPSFQENNN